MTATQQLDKDIQEWKQLTTWMLTAKEREKWLRRSIAERIFPKMPQGCFEEGTQHNIAQGALNQYKATLVTKWNRKILEESMAATLAKAGLSTDAPVIKKKYELSLSEYRKLPPATRAIVDEMIHLTEGAIDLELVELPK